MQAIKFVVFEFLYLERRDILDPFRVNRLKCSEEEITLITPSSMMGPIKVIKIH
jgi:hypothetical protein